ncbi:MFS transporter [Streptomyces sp. NPDC058464]|uniref:MFS transporter n=1 Tax=Streptomyces sp. NPDC058464 TaxID=3346511 RepID=UPI0036634FE1
MSLNQPIHTGGSSELEGSPRQWFAAIAVLVLLTEQTALGLSLIAPALGQLATKYHTTQIAWMITIFMLAGAVLTPLLGKIGDRVGKKRVLVITALVGTAGSVICALASNYGTVLMGRALMGSAAAFLPLTYSLVRDVFPEKYRNLSIGIATNGAGVVTILGPFLAGFLIDQIAPEAVFWFMAALSLAGAVGTILIVPESETRNRSAFDVPGIISLAVGLLALMYGITNLTAWGVLSARSLTFVGGGLVVLVAWWMWELRAAEPFIDPRLLSSRPMWTVILGYSLICSGMVVATSYLPTMLQTPRSLGGDYGFGLDATGVAVYCILGGIATVAVGVGVGVASRRYGFRPFLLLSGVFIIAASLVLAFLHTESWMPILGFGLVGVASMSYVAGAGLMMQLTPEKSRGVSAGMLAAIQGVIGSTVLQVAGLVLSNHVRATPGAGPGPLVYSTSGWVLTFGVGAVAGLIGLAIATLVPKPQKQAEPATGAEGPLRATAGA